MWYPLSCVCNIRIGHNASDIYSPNLYKYLMRMCSIQATSKDYWIPHVSWSNSQGSRLIGKTRAGKLRNETKNQKGEKEEERGREGGKVPQSELLSESLNDEQEKSEPQGHNYRVTRWLEHFSLDTNCWALILIVHLVTKGNKIGLALWYDQFLVDGKQPWRGWLTTKEHREGLAHITVPTLHGGEGTKAATYLFRFFK